MRHTPLVLGLAAIALLFGPLTLDAQETITVTYQGPVLIPDDPAETTMILPIFVNRAIEVTDVDVILNISHPNIGDLKIDLENPFGRTRRLADENCNGTANFVDFTFDSDAGAPYGDSCPSSGNTRLRPREEIDDWHGEDSLGMWLLSVKDSDDGNVGFLLDFTLRITGNRVIEPSIDEHTIRDSASLISGAVTQGELVWIYGINLGPAEPVSAEVNPDTGKLPTELGGTTVTFNGTPAPLLFTSLYLVRAQVPVDISGSEADVKVNFGGQSSDEVTVDMIRTSPGLYAAGTTGWGLASAVNQDGTRNSETNPAPSGSFVTLYANGLGSTTPPVASGEPAPANPLSTAVEGVTVRIGGIDAPVYYAGLAPGMVGTFQLNVEVPTGIPSGPAAVVVSASTNSSQNGMFIYVE